MQAVLSDPAENVYVRPGDVISVAREQQTFTSAGATGQNAVVPFEAMGITLDQAIARSGGLNDNRADPTGVFVIRFERAKDYDQLGLRRPDPSALSQVPVIYRVNMRDPNSFFMARRFPIRNKDILFVSNAPSMELQKAMTVLLPFLGVGASAVAVTAVAMR
jgi:polysaccharide export outer membrane protein